MRALFLVVCVNYSFLFGFSALHRWALYIQVQGSWLRIHNKLYLSPGLKIKLLVFIECNFGKKGKFYLLLPCVLWFCLSLNKDLLAIWICFEILPTGFIYVGEDVTVENITCTSFWQRLLIGVIFFIKKLLATIPFGNHAMVNMEVILCVIINLHMVDAYRKALVSFPWSSHANLMVFCSDLK